MGNVERSGIGAGRLLEVLVAQPTTVLVGKSPTVTGIRKHAQAGRVALTSAGLAGDHVMNVRHHGGPDQAVYAYTQPDLDAWAAVLGAPPPPGAFGENLLLESLESAGMRVGDQLELRATDGTPGPVLEVTAPRIPCATLAAAMQEPGFVKRFAEMRRPGAYFRILREGDVGAGDTVTLYPAPAGAPSLQELFDVWYDRAASRDSMASLLAFPLSTRLRQELRRRVGAPA
jgi:MOSC domain-containing protein YiiM